MSKITLKRGNLKRDPIHRFRQIFCKLLTHILQLDIYIDIWMYILRFGHIYGHFDMYIEIFDIYIDIWTF